MKKNKNKIPMRRCIGCMESKPKKELIRIACYEGELTLDTTGRAKGRGVYLCRSRECMEKAKKRKAIQRSFDTAVPQSEIERIWGEIENE
ncbi:MAG: RNase P modulator RnpM [Anaerovoracaceae bacterium]